MDNTIFYYSFFHLPNDMIKLIISYCPCPQWFSLCKQLNILASQVISPLDYRKEDEGSFIWACRYNKKLAVASLLRDPRVDPGGDNNNAIIWASTEGNTEIVELLLQGI
jgi:hypothetical protein